MRTENKLKELAKGIRHCGDYGMLFYHPGKHEVHWTAADSDGGGGDDDDGHPFTPLKEIEKMFSLPGVKHVEIGDEWSPDEDDGWVRLHFEEALNAKAIVNTLLETEPPPEHYLSGVPIKQPCPNCGEGPMRELLPEEVDPVLFDLGQNKIIAREGDVRICDHCGYVALVEWLKEAEEPPPEHYLGKLPPYFDADKVLQRIQTECGYCMDSPEDKATFIAWIEANSELFPDVAKAVSIIQQNDSWCTDSEDDMIAFFEALGFPIDAGDGHFLTHCECDNTHQHNDTVCRWCFARGRRHFNDPAV